MKRTEVQQLLSGVGPGTKLKLTYRRDCPQDAFYLWGMAQAGVIRFEKPGVETLIWAAHLSGNWGHDSNRVIVIQITDTPDLGWLADKASRPLESLEILKGDN